MRNVHSPISLNPGMIEFTGVDTSNLATKAELALKADASHLHSSSAITDMATILASKADKNYVDAQVETVRAVVDASIHKFTYTLSANITDLNLRNLAVANGWDQVKKLEMDLTIAPGVIVRSSSVTIPALQTGNVFPSGSTLKLTVSATAYIVGKGGRGGDTAAWGGNQGGNGGDALLLQYPISITNNGVIGGGGGGGGGGGSSYGNNNGSGGSGGAGYGDPGGGYQAGYAGSLTTGGATVPNPASPDGVGGAGGSLGQAGTQANGMHAPTAAGYYNGGAGGLPGNAVSGKSFITNNNQTLTGTVYGNQV